MPHAVGLVTYEGALHAWVLDLPGCITGARDRAQLDHALPLALAEHVAWLARHGIAVDASPEWENPEEIDSRRLDATGGEFCFEADRAPLGADELEVYIARMQFARTGLIAEIDGLPDIVLDWAPPRSSMRGFDAWAPEVRTIREIADHVLQLEAYYRDGLRDGPAKGIFEPVEDPASERLRTVEALRALSDSGRSRVYRPVRPGRAVAEDWTVRKLIRSVIAHERAHAAEVVQRRTWLLLGVPNLRPDP